MSSTIEIQGGSALIAALAQFPDVARPELERAAEAGLLSVVGPLATYPPASSRSRYRRTGTLGRTWTAARPAFQVQASGFEAKLGNATPYANEVQGEDQRPAFVGRWRTADQVLTAQQAQIQQQFDAAAERIVAKLGGS